MAISENGKRTVSVSQVSVEDLHPDPSNARTGHDLDQLMASIQEFGFADPIEAQKGTGKIIVGNGRYQAAKSLGLKTVPVVWHDMDDLEATRYGLANNRLTDKSEWDMKVLPDLLTEAGLDIPGFEDFDLPDISMGMEGAVEDQGILDSYKPMMHTCPHCGEEFDLRGNGEV